jgi:hypothetical protein
MIEPIRRTMRPAALLIPAILAGRKWLKKLALS